MARKFIDQSKAGKNGASERFRSAAIQNQFADWCPRTNAGARCSGHGRGASGESSRPGAPGPEPGGVRPSAADGTGPERYDFALVERLAREREEWARLHAEFEGALTKTYGESTEEMHQSRNAGRCKNGAEKVQFFHGHGAGSRPKSGGWPGGSYGRP